MILSRSKLSKPLSFIICLSFIFALSTDSAFAKKNSKKKKKSAKIWITIGSIEPSSTTVSISVTKKSKKKKKKKKVTKEYVIDCLEEKPGKLRTKKGNLQFASYKKLAKKNKKKRKLYKKLAKAGSKACAESPTGTNEVSFKPYSGPWGEEQARILYDRFCLAGTPEEIAWSVANGMDATVDKIMTWIHEPQLDVDEDDVICDTYLKAENHPNEKDCNAQNPNDLSTAGLRQSIYLRALGQNCFFIKFLFFLHDERMTASTSGLSSSMRHLAPKHVEMLYRAAFSGDYMQFMREWNEDGLGNYFNLDGGNNDGITAPNENYAREFWELGTVGPTDLNGNEVYSSTDIEQAALAFSGGSWVSKEINIGSGDSAWVTFPAYSNQLHAPGLKTIFAGTPYQAQVDTAEDMLIATFAHPRTAEHLAEDLLNEFIAPDSSPGSVRDLAEIIRENNYLLFPVLKILMKADEVYQENNRKSLMKHSFEYVLGFLRMTGYPTNHRKVDQYLDSLGQRFLLPPSIFGWDTDKLAGETYVLERRNFVLSLMNRSSSSLEEDDNYNLYDKFISGIAQDASASFNLIDRIATWLTIRLNQTQRDTLDQYLNYELDLCDSSWKVSEYACTLVQGEPTEANYFLRRNALVLDPEGEFEQKLQGLLAILLMLPEAQLK